MDTSATGSKQAGFTLVELVVVLLVAAVLAAVAAPAVLQRRATVAATAADAQAVGQALTRYQQGRSEEPLTPQVEVAGGQYVLLPFDGDPVVAAPVTTKAPRGEEVLVSYTVGARQFPSCVQVGVTRSGVSSYWTPETGAVSEQACP